MSTCNETAYLSPRIPTGIRGLSAVIGSTSIGSTSFHGYYEQDANANNWKQQGIPPRLSQLPAYSQPPATPPSAVRKAKTGMIKELFGDFRTYIRDNRDLIFSIVFVLVLDEYVFDGAFRERIKACIEGVLRKVEKKTGIDIPGIDA